MPYLYSCLWGLQPITFVPLEDQDLYPLTLLLLKWSFTSCCCSEIHEELKRPLRKFLQKLSSLLFTECSGCTKAEPTLSNGMVYRITRKKRKRVQTLCAHWCMWIKCTKQGVCPRLLTLKRNQPSDGLNRNWGIWETGREKRWSQYEQKYKSSVTDG